MFFAKNNKNKTYISVLLTIVLLISTLMLSACRKEENAGEISTVIKIGVLLDFSGAKAEESAAMLKAMQMAVDEINAEGVLTEKFTLELVTKDDNGDPMQSVAGFYQLVQEGVVAVIGTNNEIGMEHLVTASANSTVPVITPSVSNDTIVNAANFCYQAGYSDAYLMKALAKFTKDELEESDVAVIYARDNTVYTNLPTNHKDRNIALYEDFVAAMLNESVSVTYATELEEMEYNAVLKAFDKIMKADTRVTLVVASAEDMENIVLPAARTKGYEGVFLALPEMTSLNNTEDYTMYIPVGYTYDNPKAYVEEFTNKLVDYIHVGESTADVRSAYEAVYILRDACEAGHLATPVSIALKLPFLEGSLVLGEYEMGAYGNITKSVDIVKKYNGHKDYVTTLFE